MAFIDLIGDEEATAEAKELLERDRAALGYVANYTRLFAHRPAVYEAWLRLRDAIAASMDTRRYELATVAAAGRLRSSYCTLAHGKVLADRFMEPAQVRDVVVDHCNAGRRGGRRRDGPRREGGGRRHVSHGGRRRPAPGRRPLRRGDFRPADCRGLGRGRHASSSISWAISRGLSRLEKWPLFGSVTVRTRGIACAFASRSAGRDQSSSP